LFTRVDGLPLRAHHVHNAWTTARKIAGLPHARFHDLRHAGLTPAAQEGATLADVMKRAGHASAAAALRYQHSSPARDAEIAARLSEAATRHRSGPRMARTPVADLDAARKSSEG